MVKEVNGCVNRITEEFTVTIVFDIDEFDSLLRALPSDVSYQNFLIDSISKYIGSNPPLAKVKNSKNNLFQYIAPVGKKVSRFLKK